jgi:hypothetical protein
LNHGGYGVHGGNICILNPCAAWAVTAITGFCDVPIPVFVRGLAIIHVDLRRTAELLLK